jgi:hypothetical protein
MKTIQAHIRDRRFPDREKVFIQTVGHFVDQARSVRKLQGKGVDRVAGD